MLKNSNICTPAGALKVLQALDIERYQENNTHIKIVYYLENQVGGYSTATYKGSAIVNEEDYSLDAISLPQPTFTKTGSSRVNFGSLRVPANSILEQPRRLEFILEARHQPEYLGLRGFSESVAPELIAKGYTRHNVDHSSIFWLHTQNEKDSVLYVSAGGLYINADENNQVKRGGKLILTSQDINTLMSLKSNK
jgi:hypothetical protein